MSPQWMAQFVRQNALVLLVLAILIGLFFVLRTRGTAVASVDELQALLAGGQPVVVEFYSNT